MDDRQRTAPGKRRRSDTEPAGTDRGSSRPTPEARRRAGSGDAGREAGGTPPPAAAGAPPPDRESILLAAAIGALSLIVYVATLCPTVAGGDSGELTAAACTLGVAHPPGYPLWTILGKLFSLIPHGSIAWRVNLLSAICGAAAAALLLLAVREWTGDAVAAFAASGLFAFSALAWRYSVVAEVFALNDLFVAALLYLAARHARTPERRTTYAAVFLFALGLTNHQTLLFAGAPIVAWTIWTARRKVLDARGVTTMALLFCAGLAPYLYLPFAGASHKATSWGETDTLAGFLRHVLRSEYGTFQGLAGERTGPSLLWLSLLEYAKQLPAALLFVGVAAAAWGLITRSRREGPLGLAWITFAPFLLYLVVFQALLNLPIDQPLFLDVQSRFWLQPNLFMAFWAGAGLADLRARAARRSGSDAFRFAMYAVAFSLVALQILANYRIEDQSRNHLIERFASSVVEPLPSGALLLASGDLFVNTTRYLQECENVRRDVRVIDLEKLKTGWMRRVVELHHPEVHLPPGLYRGDGDDGAGAGSGFGMENLFDANVDRLPVYVNSIRRVSRMRWDGYDVRPSGLLYRVVRAGAALDVDSDLAMSLRAFDLLRPGDFPATIRTGSWEDVVRGAWTAARERFAQRIVDFAAGRPDETALVGKALEIMREIVRVQPDPPAHDFKNVGILCMKLLPTDPGLEADMIEAWNEYLRRAPANDPDRPRIERLLSEAIARRQRPAGR